MPPAEGQSSPASSERRPHFFKVLIGDFKKRLKIPPNFCKHIPLDKEASGKAKRLKGASKAVTLEGPSGRTWLVVVRRTAEGTFFTSGWPKFVQDQALRELEFLVFRYDGRTRFTAMVFDKTACEREDLLGGGDQYRPRKKRGRPRAASRDAARARPARPNKKDSVGKELVPYLAPSDGEQCSSWTPELVKTEADTGELPLCLQIAAPSRQPSPSHGPGEALQDGAAAVKTRSIQDDLASVPPSVRRYKGYVSRRRPVTSAERQRATEIAHAFRSPLPYCVIRMSTMHVYYSFMMRFPTGFSRQHLPRERKEVALRDPEGRAWAVLYIPNTRDRLSRGWCAFARGNCLEEGDHCVFELVAAAEFRVHIFRVVDPPVPAFRLRGA